MASLSAASSCSSWELCTSLPPRHGASQPTREPTWLRCASRHRGQHTYVRSRSWKDDAVTCVAVRARTAEPLLSDVCAMAAWSAPRLPLAPDPAPFLVPAVAVSPTPAPAPVPAPTAARERPVLLGLGPPDRGERSGIGANVVRPRGAAMAATRPTHKPAVCAPYAGTNRSQSSDRVGASGNARSIKQDKRRRIHRPSLLCPSKRTCGAGDDSMITRRDNLANGKKINRHDRILDLHGSHLLPACGLPSSVLCYGACLGISFVMKWVLLAVALWSW